MVESVDVEGKEEEREKKVQGKPGK